MVINIAKENVNLYAPRLESTCEMQNSSFKNCYLTAEHCVEELVSHENSKDIPESNNIIAFTGDRGSGKTSTMINFAKMLAEGKKLTGTSASWGETAFEILPLIEPSHITKEETVLDVILSRLYTAFNKYIESEGRNLSQETVRKAFKRFDTAFDAVRAYCKCREARHEITSSLEALTHTAAGNSIKEHMQELIKEYLKIICGKRQGFLVLLVDDVDMNITQGYHICEDLRKYFSISQVVVLFSFKESQLTDIIRQEYLEFYRTTFELGDKAEIKLTEDIADIAAKYLDKLIPFSRKCAMPEFNIANLSAARIQFGEKAPVPLVDEILHQLYDKAGILLVKNRHGAHPLIPTNLRAIIHLIKTVESMDSIKLFEENGVNEVKGKEVKRWKMHILSEAEQKTLNTNLVIINRYFMEIATDKLDYVSVGILKRVAEEPLDTLNKTFSRLVSERLNEKEKMIFVRDTTKASTLPENVDFYDLLKDAENYCDTRHSADGKDDLFIELLLVLYSTKVLRLLFDKVNSTEDFKMKKHELYKALGRIYDDKEFGNGLSTESLSIKDISDSEGALDLALMHTFYLGKFERNWKSQLKYGRYENVKRESLAGELGHTFVYFYFSAIMCISNSLSKDISIESDTYKADYESWRNDYIGILPLFSLNATYQILKKAPSVYEKQRSGNIFDNFSASIVKQLDEILDHCSITDDCKAYLNAAAKEFPVWIGTQKIFTEVGNSKSDINLGEEDMLKAFARSRDFALYKVNTCIIKFNNFAAWDAFEKAKGVDRKGKELLPEHHEFLGKINMRIAEKKKELLPMSQAGASLPAAISAVCDILHAAEDTLRTYRNPGDLNAR